MGSEGKKNTFFFVEGGTGFYRSGEGGVRELRTCPPLLRFFTPSLRGVAKKFDSLLTYPQRRRGGSKTLIRSENMIFFRAPPPPQIPFLKKNCIHEEKKYIFAHMSVKYKGGGAQGLSRHVCYARKFLGRLP